MPKVRGISQKCVDLFRGILTAARASAVATMQVIVLRDERAQLFFPRTPLQSRLNDFNFVSFRILASRVELAVFFRLGAAAEVLERASGSES